MANYKIPYAVSNYAKLRREGYFYVDKTNHIAELEAYEVPVFLRPRRFGKSLFCTMLDYYYDLNEADSFEELFGDTYIGKHPTPRHNQYMVMHLDFSIVSVDDTMEEMERNFGNAMNKTIRGFADTTYKRYFPGFEFSSTDKTADLLSDILKYIARHDLPQMYLIIDEYDNFTNQFITAFKDGMYEEMTSADSFWRTFFKVIKEGVKDASIGGIFITGVLPITMDDLTSGFNIAEMVTLQPQLVNMLGFTHTEAETYLQVIFDEYGFDKNLLPEVWQIIESNYDGYRFLPGAERIYNSTILTYFIKDFTINNGAIPRMLIDENIRTDVNWIRRLTLGTERAQEMLHTLVYDGIMPYSSDDLMSKFNRNQFFQKEFYPISLYYLGMTTLVDDYDMELPNNTLRTIFVDYYNMLNELKGTGSIYVPIFKAYLKDYSMNTLFAGYYKEYLGQFAAQSFDKMNENFVRNTFYELCVRYLSQAYTFSIEQNYPSGRCDWEMTGRPGTVYHNQKEIVELKYFTAKKSGIIKNLEAPSPDDVEQVKGYARDILKQFPAYRIRKYVIYVMANKGFRLWEV